MYSSCEVIAVALCPASKEVHYEKSTALIDNHIQLNGANSSCMLA